MVPKPLIYFSQIAHAASHNVRVPKPIAFFIRIISNLQVLSLVFCDSILSAQTDDSTFTKSLKTFISSVRSVLMLSDINSEAFVAIIAYIGFIYLLIQLIFLVYFIIQIKRSQNPHPWACKLFPVLMHLHSQVVFYPFHCLFLRLISSYVDCSNGSDATSFYCGLQWVILPSLFEVVNVILPFFTELYCFQILFKRDSFSQKENIYPMLVLSQKTLLVAFLYFLDSPQTTMILLNIMFCLVSFYILHSRLTYYDLKLLRLEIAFSTCALLFSVFMIAQAFGNNADILLLMLWIAILAIKLSLRKLDTTLKQILKLKFKNPHQAAHFSCVIKEQIDYARRQNGRKFNRGALFASGMLTNYMEGEEINFQNKEMLKKAKVQAYMVTIQKLEDLLKVYPNNQLLVLSIAQIYMKKLKDSSKTLYLLDRVKTQNIGIPIKNSIQTLCSQLDKLYSAAAQETKEKLGYLHYFEYRDKTIKLKDMIEQELNLQLKLWEAFNTDPIDAHHVIEQARIIDQSESKIYSYWQREVQNLEKLYVNAPILFGLYLEIVRGLPYTGSALIQQTYKMIVEKGVLQEDILSVSVGKSAIIIASGEAEKAGKVIDASASVKELFGIDKNYLIHSNLNLILPKTISQKHDQLIRKFHEKPSEEQNGHVKSYAKTLTDQYFPVDISLRPLPSSNGLNIVAYIKKMSSNVSLMIIDYHGRVVECSKDLQKMLNFDTRSTIELSKVCPRLVHVSQAYNIVYAPEEIPPEGMEEKDYFDTPLESPVTTEFPLNRFKESNNNGIGLKSIFMRRNRVNTVMSGHQILESELASPTRKPLKDKEDSIIYSPTEVVNLKDTMKSSSIPNNPNNDSLHIDKNNSETIDPSYGASRKNQDNPFQMSREDAEGVCYRFKKKKKLKFTIPASGTSKGVEIVPFETQVEPFMFAGQLYKIVKVRKMTEADYKDQSLVPSALAPFQKQLVNKLHSIEQTNGNGASLLFAKPENEISRSEKKKTSITPFVSAGDQSVGDMSDNGKTTAHLDYVSENEDENHSFKDDITEYLTELDIPEFRVSRASRTGSVINSSIGSTKNRAKYLDALFKRETISYATRVAIITAYLSVAVVIGSVGVDLAFTQKALREMEASIELIYISNARLFKLIAAWRGVLILYSRTAGVRPNNNARTITVFSQQIYNYTLDMLGNNDLLRQKVDAFQNEYITELFYRKNVELWLPYENQMLTGEPVDLFTANQVIATKMYFVSSFKNTPMGLLNLSEPLFAQNNTANDYLIAVQDTITELSAFFENTANNNVSLLKVIVALESLALVIPFVALLVLFKIITTSHQKLFRVISKIRKKNVESRIAQLNKMSTYLKKNVEDSVIIYKDDISSQLAKAKLDKHKDGGDDPMSRSRLYTLKNLIWRMALYLIFTLVLFTVITVLFWTSFNSATSGFAQLIRLNSQVNTAFYYGSYISSLLSEFYYVLIFAGQSSFKIKNDSPNNQLRNTINILGQANQGLVTALSTPGKGIDDPWIESFLNQRICDYDLPANKGNCGLVTLKNGVGLLGLNQRFYTVCAVPMLIYLAAPTPALGVSTMNAIVTDLGNFHTTAMDVYQVLADTLYAKVLVKKQEEADLTLVYFKWNLVVIVIVMLLVRIVVIRKYKSLDLSVKKILKLIPFHIIQNNKAIMFYLSKEFESEISDLTKMKN